MSQHQVMLAGQALAGSQYSGQRLAPLRTPNGRPGQRAVSGPESTDQPDPFAGKCGETREVEGAYQRCGAWAVKDSEPPRCIGHKRSNERKQEQVTTNDDEPTADPGLRQDAP